MKKNVLFMICFLLAWQLNSQQRIQKKNLLTKATQLVSPLQKMSKAVAQPLSERGISDVSGKQTTISTQKSGAVAGTVVGTSTYDLQTNNSICNRLFMDSDGGLHATWTYSNSYDAAAPDRGTGYVYSPDGGETWEAAPNRRLESDRNGWPNVVVTESGRIVVVSHFAGAGNFDGGLSWARKDVDGQWIHEAFPVGDDTDTWARMAVSGNTIHVIAARQPENLACDLKGGLSYFRSTDAGDTWEVMPCMSALAPTNSPGLRGDTYAIDVNGDNVAIVVGNYRTLLLKSTDGGDTWTSNAITTVDNPLYPDRGPTSLGDDPVVASDGAFALLLDNQGNAHIWYGRILGNDDDGEGFGFYPDNNGIMYWNETMGDAEPSIIGITVKQDVDGDGEFIFDNNVSDAGTYRNTNVSMPSAGIDTDGNLYVTYSSIVEDAVDANTNYFRDLFAIKSTDGGATWIGPYNITNNPTEEAVYGAVARKVDGSLHVLYMSDAEIGNAVDGFAQTAFALNEFRYVNVPIEMIANPEQRVNTHPNPFIISIPNAIQDCEVGLERFNAFAIDYPDGDLTDKLVISGVDVSIPSETAGPWVLSVTDSDENKVTETLTDVNNVPFLVTVYADEDSAIIVGGPYNIIIENDQEFYETYFDDLDTVDVVINTDYNDLGATVIDNADTFGCPATLTTNNTVNTSEIGVYTVTYNAVDNVGNESEPLVRVVNVVSEDVTAPKITLFTDEAQTQQMADGDTLSVEVSVGDEWQDPGYLAIDNVDGILTEQVTIVGTVDIEIIGIYTIMYTATDNASNESSVTRYLNVRDTQPPVINLAGPSTLIAICGSVFNETNLGFTAFDNVDGNITTQVVITYFNSLGDEIPTVNTEQADTYEIKYTVSDSNGNATETIRTVVVPAPCGFPLGIKENTLNANIEIYPNPSKGLINIDLSTINTVNVQVDIFNVSGDLVQQSLPNISKQSQLQLDLAAFTTGIYFAKIYTSDGVITKKLMIHR